MNQCLTSREAATDDDWSSLGPQRSCIPELQSEYAAGQRASHPELQGKHVIFEKSHSLSY